MPLLLGYFAGGFCFSLQMNYRDHYQFSNQSEIKMLLSTGAQKMLIFPRSTMCADSQDLRKIILPYKSKHYVLVVLYAIGQSSLSLGNKTHNLEGVEQVHIFTKSEMSEAVITFLTA